MSKSPDSRCRIQIGRTMHEIVPGDARDLSSIPDESIHLVCTSPPYGSLIRYPDGEAQLGNLTDYECFLDELDRVWRECRRVLVPGGRIACVVGDVLVSRRQGGRHHVLPLTADIQVRARKIGLDCLTPIRWFKVGNIALEASRSARYLGKPNLPNGIVKNDIEQILFLRKPGGYRSPTDEQQQLSYIASNDYAHWFSAIWTDVTGERRTDHPAPFPVEIPRRLIRMFSFVGDTVLDPFGGTGTTAVAAAEADRHSITVDVEPSYIELAYRRLSAEAERQKQLSLAESPTALSAAL